MSRSSNTLTVSTAPLAEISVLDGSMNTVARSVGGLTKELSPGLYKIRVRNGPGVEEELVSLDQDRSVEIKAPPFFSPIPLEGTTRSHEYHMQRAVDASRNPRLAFGEGSGLFVFCREWSKSGSGSSVNPAGNLSLSDDAGNILSELGQSSIVESTNDASAAWCAKVAPGAYRLRLEMPGGTVTERALFASPGCQTQIFILLASPNSPDAGGPVPDLAGGAVVISPRYSFDPQDRRTQLGEIARYALTQKRRVLTDELRHEIVDQKFDDPMLGLLGAHLVLRDEPENTVLFATVTNNLCRLVGQDHPDLRALCLRRATPLPQVPRYLETPPMLRASWDIAVAASLEDPSSFSESGSVAEIADKIIPTGSWLVWRKDPTVESVGESSASASSALVQSVAAYVAARARLEAAKRPNDPELPLLDDQDKAELARVLGIPGPMLETILRKIVN